MNKVSRLIIVILFIAFPLASISTPACAERLSFLHGNDRHIVSYDSDNTLIFLDVRSGTVHSKRFDFIIKQVELCPVCSFVSIIGMKEYKNGNNTSRNKIYLLYDFENDRLYDRGMDIEPGESRWSADGKYTYFHEHEDESIVLVKTIHLVGFLENHAAEDTAKVTGHPLGLIWQEAWLGDYLVYGSGIGESECWGILDISAKVNYFVSCCGVLEQNVFEQRCSTGDTEDNIIKIFGKQMDEGRLNVISMDFYKDSSSIIGK